MFVRIRSRLKTALLFAGLEAVSNPWLGDDIARRRCFRLQLLAELANEYAQILNLFRTLPTPDCAQQRPMGYHFAGMACKINQQIKFLRREVNLATTHRDFVRRQIDAEITNLNQRSLLAFRRDAPQTGTYPRQQFLDPERLGYVVVGSGIQRLDFGFFLSLN